MAYLVLLGILISLGLAAVVFVKSGDRLLPASAIFVIGVLLVTFGYIGLYKSTERTETITVVDKERTSGDSGQWVVFTEDGRTFGVTDSLAYFNWRASDRYGKLKVNATYDCTIAGWRIGFFSEYPNLIECELTEQDPAASID